MDLDPRQKAMDDWLNEGLEESMKKAAQTPAPPKTIFPGPPTGNGVPVKPAPPPAKVKSLETLGIGKGGIVRNASTTVLSALNNPVANPKKAPLRQSSILDSAELTPEFGVPPLMGEMDANFEQRAKEKAEQ